MQVKVTNRSPLAVYVVVGPATPAEAPIFSRSQLDPGLTEVTNLPGTFEQQESPLASERPFKLAKPFRLRVESLAGQLLAESEFTGSALFVLESDPESRFQLRHEQPA